MDNLVQPTLAFISAHSSWAFPVMFVTSFGESFAFLSLLFPGTSILIVAGTLMSAGTLPFWPVVVGAVIGAVLGGLHAPITVGGQTYNGTMPPWKGTLSNKDIADVITYIRGSLGNNHASPVTEAQVKSYKP